ncbi:3-dehydroquinate synthase [Oceanibium sediminis]|uniref:3-dehydroquinate synthase n=1 Tax=Oceanibium sediminis TaxID=2026339 RepID=UPI00351A7684
MTDTQNGEIGIEEVRVELPGRAYPIRIGAGLLARFGAEVAPYLNRQRLFVVTDRTVAGLHLDTLRNACAAEGISVEALALPPGEATKSWAELQHVVEWLLEMRAERDDIVVALGGGVIGDLTGFAAAIMRRGIGFVQVPTTLLAQVDSSVGGKTAINSPLGKNLVGAFYQPKLVVADTGILDTLPRRDFLAGYGEVMKTGLLGDADFFAWLEANGPALRDGDAAARRHAVRRSCEMKAAIVTRDETEQGDRALLNLGHTFCHALEAATGYSDRLLHGEGVAIGCGLAFEVSQRLGLCPQEDPGRVFAHMAAMGLKAKLSDIAGALPGPDALIDLMRQDKKVRDGAITFILARGIGEAFVARDVDLAPVRAVLVDALATQENA